MFLCSVAAAISRRPQSRSMVASAFAFSTKSTTTRYAGSVDRSTRLFSTESAAPEEKTEEEKAAIKAVREERKAEKERQKAEKAAKKAIKAAAEEEANRIHPVTYLSASEQDSYEPYGDMATIMSRGQSGRNFARVTDIGGGEDAKHGPESTVWLRGRISSIRVKGGSCFLVLRQDSFDTVQACFFKDKENPEQSAKMIKYLKSLTVESVVDLEGTVAPAEVRSCSIKDAELVLSRIHSVSNAASQLPFLVEDAARSEADVEASQGTDRPFPRLGQELRLDNRWLDLRAPANNAILRVQSAICQLFREALYARGFVEVHTP